ncbi:MAG: YceI family protein [Opitutales bacterium]|jgi:polyisoprenoid-binding protein YceI|nr:YceI family protein [Opitutales bacterium]
MKLLLLILPLVGAAAHISADSISFDFADPKGVNTINFHLDALLESTSGNAKGVSGLIQYDPQNPGNTTGTLQIDTKSLYVANPRMREHLHGPTWMDVAKHPDILFTVGSLKDIDTTGNITTADVNGELTVKGVTRPVLAKATLTYLKGKLKARMGPRGPDGDILVIRTKFSINRTDYGINSGQLIDRVSDEIEISLSIAGQAPN